MGLKKKKKARGIRLPGLEPVSTIRLSVCMIVKNEERKLDECLRMARGFADEIILVDTGSSDRTVSIAEKHGISVHHFDWIDDFSSARNESLKHARGKWIVWIDADDRLYPDQHFKIKQLAATEPDRAYNFLLKNDGFESSQCYQLRMFPNRPDIRFERPVHEQVATSIARIGLPVETRDVVLIHTGYNTETVVNAKKKRYIAMMEKWLQTNPDDMAIRYQLGLALHTMKRNAEAIQAFNYLVENAADSQKKEHAYYYSVILLGRALLDLNRPEESLHILRQAESINPQPEFLKISLAEAFIHLGQSNKAITYLEKAGDMENREVSFFPIDFSQLEYGRLVLLGKAKLDTGFLEDAKENLFKAMTLKPSRPEAIKHYAEWLRRKGSYSAAIKQLQIASGHDPGNFYYDYEIGDIFKNLGWLAKASRFFQKALELNAGHPGILMNLAQMERDCGRFGSSLGYFERLRMLPDRRQDLNLQYLICQMDAGNIETLVVELGSTEIIGPLLWLGHLVDLYNEKTDLVREKLCGGQDDLMSGNNDDVAQYLVRLADRTEREGDLYTAELELRAALFFVEAGPIPVLSQLSRVLMMNKRLFQATATLEAILSYSDDPKLTINTLEQIAQCYLLMGVEEAHQMCKDRIQKLQSEAASAH